MLIGVVALSVQKDGCDTKTLLDWCASLALGGRHIDHRKTLNLCVYAGLLAIAKGKVVLTEIGKEFLGCNPESFYELTDDQKSFLAQRVIFSGRWRSRIRNLLFNFSPNYDKITYELFLTDNLLSPQLDSTAHLLQHLGIIEEDNAVLSVTPPYVVFVRDLVAERRMRTEKELEQALQQNRKLGTLAEEAVVDFEKSRLKFLGVPEAESVRRISDLDVGAGYDIQSFDGDKRSFEHDRFIEVKASVETELRFYWTANEHRVAEKLGDRYWIYFVGGFHENPTAQIKPVMIRNPVKRLKELAFTLESSVYLVRARENSPKGILAQFGQNEAIVL